MLTLAATVLIAASGPTEMTLKAGPVTVPSRFVRLGQIADVAGGEGLERMVVLTLGEGGAFVTRGGLMSRLSARGVTARIDGPAYVQVRLEGSGGAAGAKAASQSSSTEGTAEDGLAVLRRAALSGAGDSSSGRLHLRLDAVNAWGDDGPVDSGNLSDFRVEATGGGGGVRWARFSARDAAGGRVHGWARFNVEERVRAVAAKVPMRRGELLAAGKLEMKEISVPLGRFEGFESLETIAGKHAARDIRAGAVLETADVKRELAVLRGSILTASLGGEGFQLTDRVVAMKDAEEGEVIAVKNCRSGSVFRAKVLSRHSVVPVE